MDTRCEREQEQEQEREREHRAELETQEREEEVGQGEPEPVRPRLRSLESRFRTPRESGGSEVQLEREVGTLEQEQELEQEER